MAAALDIARGDDMAAGIHQRDHRQRQRGLAARRRNGADPAFERRHTFFKHRHRRVRYARIDVAGAFEIEQGRGMIDIGKYMKEPTQGEGGRARGSRSNLKSLNCVLVAVA